MKKFDAFYRTCGNENAPLRSIRIKADDVSQAEIFAYWDIDDNQTVVGIAEVY